mgnify:CR=1 FL=1
MKKKIIISIIGCLILIIGIIGFIILNNNRIVSTFTLDINPSIEINLDKNDKVKSVVALNEDGKGIISKDLKGKSLDDTFDLLITNLIDGGFIEDNYVDVIVYSNEKLSSEDIGEKVEFSFGKKEVHAEIIVIDKITKEDEELAKKYNVTPAKMSYIKTIIQDNKNVNLEDLANKPVNELKETKETGKYCDKGYTLEGDWCLIEKERVSAISGEVCPRGYAEHEGKCYEEIRSVESNNYICNEGFKLIDNICVMNEVTDAFGKCSSGNYDQGYCVEKEYIGEATEFCRDPGRTLYEHKCLATKPAINGGCIGKDMYYNGKCLNPYNDYYMSEWKCPDGMVIPKAEGSLQYEDKKCYKETKTKPTSYYCETNAKLEGTKCVINRTEGPLKEMSCPSGTIPIDDGSRCLNLNKIATKESGLVCEGENTRLKGKDCITYEMKEAKSNLN